MSFSSAHFGWLVSFLLPLRSSCSDLGIILHFSGASSWGSYTSDLFYYLLHVCKMNLVAQCLVMRFLFCASFPNWLIEVIERNLSTGYAGHLDWVFAFHFHSLQWASKIIPSYWGLSRINLLTLKVALENGHLFHGLDG